MKWKLSLCSGGGRYARSWVCVLEANVHAADDRYVSLQRQLGATQPRARRPGRHEKRGVERRRRGGGASLMVPQKSITRAVLAWREKERPYAAHYSRVSQEQTCAGPERLRRDPSPAAAPRVTSDHAADAAGHVCLDGGEEESGLDGRWYRANGP